MAGRGLLVRLWCELIGFGVLWFGRGTRCGSDELEEGGDGVLQWIIREVGKRVE